jgi:murein DD-endopeptidase MepM/ murein hydrolase activator NlpD
MEAIDGTDRRTDGPARVEGTAVAVIERRGVDRRRADRRTRDRRGSHGTGAPRQWTVVIVPQGSDSPRELTLSAGRVRLLKAALWGSGAIVVAASLILGLAVARGRVLATFGIDPTSREVASMRTRVGALQDTIASLERRNDQVRLMAGLPAADSAGTTPPGYPTIGPVGGEAGASSIGRLASATRTDIDDLIRRANTLSASFANVTSSFSHQTERLSATPSIMPTRGWLSSEFSRARFHPILHVTRPHEGIDLAAPYGSAVVAPADGVVERVSEQTGYGMVLEIDHGNGVETKYAHLSRIDVHMGQRVTRGQPIAAVGNSGLSTGPHLHYEVHVNGKVVDPLTYVLPGAIVD